MKSTRFWLALAGGILALSLAAALILYALPTPAPVAQIYQDGVLLRTIDLSQVEEPYSFTVDGPAGGNTILVEPGRIRVSHAGCPDQVCVGQGWLSHGVTPIVCLPNRLVIQLQGGQGQSGVDGVTG